MHRDERSLADYLEDIREIRETMLMAENRLHVRPSFFYAMGALLAGGTAVHAVADAVWSPPLPTMLLAIWLPVLILAGVAEAAAWVERGRRESLPWLSRQTVRFFATMGGVMVAVVVLGVAALVAGYSAAGIVLVLAACLFHGYSPYSPGISIWIGWILLAPGVGLVVADVSGAGLIYGAAGLVVLAFLVAGLAEARYARSHE